MSAARQPGPVLPPAERQRRRDLAEIHALRKQLGWGEDEYRDIMAQVCAGVRSAGLLDAAGRARFAAHLRGCAARMRGAPERLLKAPLTKAQRKMWALWMALADAGLVRHRTMLALSRWVEAQTGVARVEWLTQPQEQHVIEQLKRWRARGGAGPAEGAAAVAAVAASAATRPVHGG